MKLNNNELKEKTFETVTEILSNMKNVINITAKETGKSISFVSNALRRMITPIVVSLYAKGVGDGITMCFDRINELKTGKKG